MKRKKAKKKISDRRRYCKEKRLLMARIGDKCKVCGRKNTLEIDHIDPKQKSFDVIKEYRGILPEELAAEIAKCQLLCRKHHQEKTLRDRGQVSARGTHGSLSSYRYCKCELCTKAHSDYCDTWNKKARINKKRRAARRKLNE